MTLSASADELSYAEHARISDDTQVHVAKLILKTCFLHGRVPSPLFAVGGEIIFCVCVCVCVLLSLAFQMANCSFYKHFTGLQRFQTAQVCWFHSESLHSLSTFLSYSFSHVEAKQPHFKVLTT